MTRLVRPIRAALVGAGLCSAIAACAGQGLEGADAGLPPPPAPGCTSGCGSRWKRLADLPTARFDLAAVAGSDGRIYAIGGSVGSTPDSILRTVDAYDPATNSWSAVPSLSAPRTGLAAAVGADGRIYAIGGAIDAARTAEALIPGADHWTPIAPPFTPREFFAAAPGPDGRIYAIGGWDALDQFPVEVYDPSRDHWSGSAPGPAQELTGLGAVLGTDGRIYAVGGGHGPTASAYDPSHGSWVTLAPMLAGQDSVAAAARDGRIFAIGGYPDFSTVEAYDPASDRWSRVEGLPSPRQGLAAVTGADGRIYVIGGISPSGYALATVEALTP
jgi:hypothetical protein